MAIFAGMLASHKEKGETVFSGADAFKLYDTYGFPLDLTKEMAADEGMTVDEPAFQTLMKEQRERARAARSSDETAWAGLDLGLDNLPTKFTGYERLHDDCTILAIVAEDELRERVGSGVHASIVLDKTPFYAEMGGQSADHGLLILKDAVFEVHDVQKNKAGKVLHHGVMVSGNLAVGDKVNACVDTGRRKAIMRAHSATHLLHKALRTVLGDHVHQAGSLVEPDRLRFDFTHFSAMKPEEIASVERMVNEAVLEGFPITVKEMPIAEARSIGAMALFGEKYGDVVRVVDMGDGYSVEFCGGTHLDNTAKVGSLRIVSEFSVASGVRRIEAITGQETLKFMENNTRLLMTLSERLKAKPEELLTRAEARTSEIRELRSELEKFRGREMLSEELRHNSLTLDDVLDENVITPILKRLSFGTVDDLYAAIGYGGVTATRVANRLRDEVRNVKPDRKTALEKVSEAAERREQQAKKEGKAVHGILVAGLSNCLVKFSRCCTPVPGDDIIGFITRGQGVSIHRRDCANCRRLLSQPGNEGRCVDVEWAGKVDDSYQTTVVITAKDRSGIVLDIAAVLNVLNAKVRTLSARDNCAGTAVTSVTLEVKDAAELKYVMNRLSSIQGVISVARNGG